MRISCLVLMMVIFMAAGCSAEPKIITGTVVDAETGSPIEGAVVLVEWTKAEGVPGLASTKSYKVVEAVTDKDGKFTVEDVNKLLIGQPDVTVYKKGYVAWNNEDIFPDYRHREDFKWQNGHLFRMDKFKKGYSYEDHVSFIRSSINASLNLESKKSIYKAFEWETDLAFEERMKTKAKSK